MLASFARNEDVMSKVYRFSKNELKPLAEGRGLCVVSDAIVIDGKLVGYAYREEPEDNDDSGWRFLAGDESDAYIDNSKNFSLVDLNLVANCDPVILTILDAEVGNEFDRVDDEEFLNAKD